MAYLEQVPSLAGLLLKCRRAPALYTRRGVQEGQAWFVPPTGLPYPIPDSTVVQVRNEDLRQEIYGTPIATMGGCTSIDCSELPR